MRAMPCSAVERQVGRTRRVHFSDLLLSLCTSIALGEAATTAGTSYG